MDCRSGQCLVAGIGHYVGVPADRTRDGTTRREALKFVAHFIGEIHIHQPLHAGYREDKGGNTRQVEFDGRVGNWHRVWDSGLLAQRRLAAQACVRMLDSWSETVAIGRVGPARAACAQWAEESCRITAQAGFYPSAHTISQACVDARLPVAEQRLRVAGYRLASVLNVVLAADTAAGRHR